MPDADLGSPTEPASLQSSSAAVDIVAAASAIKSISRNVSHKPNQMSSSFIMDVSTLLGCIMCSAVCMYMLDKPAKCV